MWTTHVWGTCADGDVVHSWDRSATPSIARSSFALSIAHPSLLLRSAIALASVRPQAINDRPHHRSFLAASAISDRIRNHVAIRDRNRNDQYMQSTIVMDTINDRNAPTTHPFSIRPLPGCVLILRPQRDPRSFSATWPMERYMAKSKNSA